MTRPKNEREIMQVSYWIRSSLVMALKELAARKGRPQWDLIEEALADLLAKPEPPPPGG